MMGEHCTAEAVIAHEYTRQACEDSNVLDVDTAGKLLAFIVLMPLHNPTFTQSSERTVIA